MGFSLKNTAVTSHTTVPSSETNSHFLFLDGNDRYWGSYAFCWLTDGTTETRLQHTNYSTSGGQGWWQLAFGATKDFNNVYFRPLNNATINLGDSTKKWKTLNGVNPGALSLPDYNNVLDVTSEVPIASLDGSTDINLNDYVPNITGWLSIVIANTTGNFIKATQGRAGTAVGYNASRSYHSGAEDNEFISLFMPILAGTWKSVYIKASSLIQMRFYYCLGNV